jgi:hypothetical protein
MAVSDTSFLNHTDPGELAAWPSHDHVMSFLPRQCHRIQGCGEKHVCLPRSLFSASCCLSLESEYVYGLSFCLFLERSSLDGV